MIPEETKKRFAGKFHHVLGQRFVMAGHPYMIALQKVVEEGVGADRIQEVAYQTLLPMVGELKAGGLKGFELLDALATLFKENGWGEIELSGLTEHGGEAVVSESYFGMGWYSRYGRRSQPVCHFIRGFLQAVMDQAYGIPPNKCHVTEIECFANNLEPCRFHIEVAR